MDGSSGNRTPNQMCGPTGEKALGPLCVVTTPKHGNSRGQPPPAGHSSSSHNGTLSAPLPPPQTERESPTPMNAHVPLMPKPSTPPCSPAPPSRHAIAQPGGCPQEAIGASGDSAVECGLGLVHRTGNSAWQEGLVLRSVTQPSPLCLLGLQVKRFTGGAGYRIDIPADTLPDTCPSGSVCLCQYSLSG